MKTVKLSVALLVVLALSATGLAYASSQFKQSSVITLTATKAGKPTGLKANIESSDPVEQPQGLKTLTITLPTGTKFNFKSKSIKRCTAPAAAIKLGNCPAKSKIGSGTAIANGAPVLPPVIPENAVAYAGKNQIVFLLTPAMAGSGQVLVLYGKVQANKVTTNVPVINLGGINIVITALKLAVNKIGSGSNAFITAGKCTAGKFVVKSSFLYQNEATLALSSSSKCSK